ncbi:MAG: FHA domain-containing protein [Planctomycetes bacterium]|nr:FHA domain-containing protein [Planctomycetota bacterium]
MALVTLRVLDGADRGRVYEDLSTPVTIGREEGNSVQLNDERVSRFHLKVQEDRESLVLTDLESTNGTKVNGEEVQLRNLRHGDLIVVGRSAILFGSSEEIARRLATLRGGDLSGGVATESGDIDAPLKSASLDFELNWGEDSDARNTLHTLLPPELPTGLSAGQAAQLSELIQYLHLRFRRLLASVKIKEKSKSQRISVDLRRWQDLIDMQNRLASYLRAIGEPES